MSTLASTVQAFFTDYLTRQRSASAHTIAAYRDALKLLLAFTAQRTGKQPSDLEIADLDAPAVGAFLEHLESDRGNGVRTRNARLAAVHALFRFAALRHLDDAAGIQRVLAIPPSALTTGWSPISPSLRSPRCSPHRTPRPGPDDVITQCWYWPFRPGCGSPS
jgi:integrase